MEVDCECYKKEYNIILQTLRDKRIDIESDIYKDLKRRAEYESKQKCLRPLVANIEPKINNGTIG